MKRKKKERDTAGKGPPFMPDYQDKCKGGQVMEWSRIEEKEHA